MRIAIGCLVLLICFPAPSSLAAPPDVAAPASPPKAAGPAAKPAEVSARVEKMEYPVRQADPPAAYPYLKKNPRLTGKDKYTTEAVVLENEYVKAVVLPEFGARLPRVTFKKAKRDLFWANDVLEDALPWAMGGTRFSFPCPEHGRHLDESAGYRLVKGPDGSVTVALDLRFSQYKDEARRYGRFSALRQAIYVTLRPGANWIEYTARVDNPLPVRHGFRLWNVAQFPRQDGAEVLFPVGAVTDPGAPAMRPWPTWDEVDHSRLGRWAASSFSVDTQGDWAGVYYGQADANHLVLKPRYTAPGARLYVAEPSPDPAKPGRGDAMIEIGTGSNMLFDHPGHYLPPFGTYVMPLRLAMVTGIGRVDWANESVALSYDAPDKDGPATIRVVGFQVRGPVTVMARGRAETAKVTGVLRPEAPLVLRLARRAEPVLVNIVEGESADLAEVSLPWKPAPTGAEAFRTLQKQVQAKDWLAAELADWPREGAVTLAEAGPMLAKSLSAARIDPALQAARVLLRTEVPPSPRWQAIRNALEVAARSQPENRYIQMYLAMMMTVENGGRPGGPAADHASKAGNFPGARYLVALAAIGSKNLAGALPHLRACGAVGPDVAVGLGSAGIEGNDRVHPAATVEAQWPTLTAAAVLMALQRPKGAIDLLEPTLAADPARPEAMALLADAYAKAGEAAKAQKAAADAKGLFQMNDQAQKDYQRLLREAQEGLWSPLPRPDAATKPAG